MILCLIYCSLSATFSFWNAMMKYDGTLKPMKMFMSMYKPAILMWGKLMPPTVSQALRNRSGIPTCRMQKKIISCIMSTVGIVTDHKHERYKELTHLRSSGDKSIVIIVLYSCFSFKKNWREQRQKR